MDQVASAIYYSNEFVDGYNTSHVFSWQWDKDGNAVISLSSPNFNGDNTGGSSCTFVVQAIVNEARNIVVTALSILVGVVAMIL